MYVPITDTWVYNHSKLAPPMSTHVQRVRNSSFPLATPSDNGKPPAKAQRISLMFVCLRTYRLPTVFSTYKIKLGLGIQTVHLNMPDLVSHTVRADGLVSMLSKLPSQEIRSYHTIALTWLSSTPSYRKYVAYSFLVKSCTTRGGVPNFFAVSASLLRSRYTCPIFPPSRQRLFIPSLSKRIKARFTSPAAVHLIKRTCHRQI